MNIFSCQHPEHVIEQQQALLLNSAADTKAFALAFSFSQYYLPGAPTIELLALVHLKKNTAAIAISTAVFVADSTLKAGIENLSSAVAELQAFAQSHRVPWLDLSAPLVLDPIKIAKPWGQEIWYTGIESRGQSQVIAQGFLTPLPWLLALMPVYLSGGDPKNIILLKTLDPLPQEVYGDLYFEMHQQKREVYVVTHIDPQAWPDNTGQIRLGFSRDKLAQYATAAAFKEAYLKAVAEYEVLRRRIDQRLDAERDNGGQALSGADIAALMSKIPEALQGQEQQAREHMNSFTAVQPLRVGDVVKIPCYVPHALQHGVRTLELQTPVYERLILSFAQKVLTQLHWDTQEAMAKVELIAPEREALRVLSGEGDEVLLEEIVRFDDFCAIRANLAPHQTHHLTPQASYGLLMPIAERCVLTTENLSLEIAAETAVFIPHHLLCATNAQLCLSATHNAVQVMLAYTTR